MPIYYYRCDACGHEFQRKQRMTDEAVHVCPECEGEVHRVIQPVGVIFRGSGFYITDNRQVSSPTLTPPKELDKPKEVDTPKELAKPEEKKALEAGKPKKEIAAPKKQDD